MCQRLVQGLGKGQLAATLWPRLDNIGVGRVDRCLHDLDDWLGTGLAVALSTGQLFGKGIVDLLHALLTDHTVRRDGVLETRQGIAIGRPILALGLGARVTNIDAHGMLAPAISHRLDQRRTLPGTGTLDRLGCDQMHLGDIVTVYRDPGDTVACGTRSHLLHRRGVAIGCAQRVLIVLANKDDRQLPHRGEI